MSVSAYKRTLRDNQSPRDVERQILNRVTKELGTYAQSFDEAESLDARMTILAGGLRLSHFENLRLWSMFKADLQNPDNQLPAEFRAQLISLAYFVERQSNMVIGARGKIAPLLAINRSLIDGLAGISPEAA